MNAEKKINEDGYSQYNAPGSDLRNVQLACLEILRKFKAVCRENDLRYYLAYGTLLGAVRHRGYIPWDDDIDVWMPRPDMEKFLSVCQQQMAPFIINFYTIPNNAFIKYRSQPCIEDPHVKVGINLGGKVRKGNIWIDIMPLDGMPSRKYKVKCQCRRFRFWYAVIGFARSSAVGAFNPASKTGLKKLGMQLNECFHIGKLFDISRCLDSFERCRKKYRYEDSRYIVGTTTTYTDKAVFLKKWFEGCREMEYEGEFFSVPVQAEKVLTRLYGNYMELPPENKRSGSHFQVLNVEDLADEEARSISD